MLELWTAVVVLEATEVVKRDANAVSENDAKQTGVGYA